MCGHVMRRYEELILRKVSRTDKPGKMKRGRPITRWNDACQCDVESTGLRAGEEMDRAPWSWKIFSHTGDPMTGEDEQYFFKINWGSGLISSRSLTDPSNVHVLPTTFSISTLFTLIWMLSITIIFVFAMFIFRPYI